MSTAPDSVSGGVDGPMSTQRGLQHALYMQKKLEGVYKKTSEFLAPGRERIAAAQNVLVWNRPMASAVLYLLVHFAFVVLASIDQSLLTRLGSLLLWCALADILWRAATNQFSSSKKENIVSSRLHIPSRPKKIMSFENAVILKSTPLKPQELPCFEVVCLWIAECLMWLDNLSVALRHWSINEPYLFGVCIFVPGVFLSLLGKYVPTLAVLYILVISLLVWPYVAFHDLWTKFTQHVITHYPEALEKAKMAWLKFKAFVSKDRAEFAEISLDPIEDVEAFQEPTAPDRDAREMPHPPASVPHPLEVTQTGDPHDPGMSLLLDSVLGLRPNAFQNDSLTLGSLSLGPGDMPSLSDLDQSLTLPQFPSRMPSHDLATMPSIAEQDDVILPARPADLDPFTDSLEVGFDFTDSRPHPLTNTQPHPLDQMRRRIPEEPAAAWDTGNTRLVGFEGYGPEDANLAYLDTATNQVRQIAEGGWETGNTRQTGFNTGYGAGCGYLDGQTSNYPQGYVPPPTYRSALDGSDGGMSGGRSQGDQHATTAGDTTEKGGYWLRQRH